MKYARNTIDKCYQRAIQLGNQYFAVQNRVECFTSKDAGRTYAKYGRSGKCKDLRGGGWAQNVYEILGGKYLFAFCLFLN